MTRPERVVAIVQARMGATRLPGKVLADVVGRPILWHVVERVRRSRRVQHVLVATTTEDRDQPVVDFCEAHGIDCFRGSEADVLDRFYQAARYARADVVVRVTADCPLIDWRVIDRVIETFAAGGCDYATNTLRYTYPDGLDVEVFSWSVLERTWREARLPAEREHVTPYTRTSGAFSVLGVESEVDLSSRNLRWTVDQPEDLDFVRAVYGRLWSTRQDFVLEDVLRLLEEEPHLMEIDKGIVRNEGYYTSLLREAPMPPVARRLDRSQELKAKAALLIPSCTQTFSKSPTQFVQGVAPTFLERAQGSHVWDVDGNEYIDYPMALGPVILGHNYETVTEAVVQSLRSGTAFSLPHPLEVELAEVLVDVIPCAEMVRFGKNGSDATSGAIRAARAFTGRDVVACCGYHGWQDWYIGTTTRNKGVPKAVQRLTVPFEYNRIERLERVFVEHRGQVAAVIMEPVGVVEPREGFLQDVRDLAHREGALLIFDEVVTGFRLALGGAQQRFGVTPDLACFGKAMGNGFPIAAVVGRRDVMELFDEIFFSFTFGGDVPSLAASLATIAEIRARGVIEHIWAQGQKLKDGYNVLARAVGVDRYTACVGLPPRTVVTFKDGHGQESLLFKSLFQQECLKRGVLFSGGQNVCYSHSDADVDRTLRVYRTALEILATAIREGDVQARLEGPPVQPVFRQV